MPSKLKIVEKHISEWALPGEKILSWIKWEENYDFDQILIKAEADINLHRVLNVEKKVLTQKSIRTGKAVIDREMLLIDGFVGFGCVYELVPEQERELTFEIEFVRNNETLETVPLRMNLIRPIIAVENLENCSIVMTRENPALPQLSISLANKGRGRVSNCTPFIKAVDTAGMQITLKQTAKKINDDALFVSSIPSIIPKIIVEGEGHGLVSVGFEYFDAIKNRYASKLIDIPIYIEQKQSLEIPIVCDLGEQPIVLEPKIS